MEMTIQCTHQAYVNDRSVYFFTVDDQNTDLDDIIGTASSDGSVRSMVTSASGPPLAPSFLSSLSSTPPVSIPPPNPPPPAVPASSAHYTRLELTNVHFVHSLALLEHVVCSKQARKTLFPLNINNEKQGKLSIPSNVSDHIFFSSCERHSSCVYSNHVHWK